MVWWLWVLVGFALLAIELFTPGGFFTLFFGLGALAVAVPVGLGIVSEVWVQWLLFTAVSLVALVTLRSRLVSSMRVQGKPVDTLAGETGTALEDLAPGKTGKAELRGTAWTARNAGDQPLAKGARVRVERVDGLTLFVRAE